MKKAASIFLALTLIVTSLCFANFEALAKTATSGKLSASVSSTIYTGAKATITTKYNKKKVTKGIKYKSSNKKVASVSKKGVVKGSKAGSATITVKYKKKSVKLKITVKKAKKKATSKVGSKTVKFDSNGGILAGSLKTKKGYIKSMPISYKNGYRFTGWYSGKTLYDYGTKITKSVTLKAKFKKLSENDYLEEVNTDYIKIYNNAYYDEYQDVMVDSGKGWDNNTAVRRYFIKNSLPKGYCPNKYFNPKAYIEIVKSKYGITLSSYKEALDFYLGCGEYNGDTATYKCIHNGGKYDDTYVENQYEYYPNVYETYEPMGDNYAMVCSDCGKYFYGETKHDDWLTHETILEMNGLPTGSWAWSWDRYDIFYKKEDHEHTDTIQSSYCQSKGKKVSQKLIERKYTPYRTDVPISYPPTGPVWWYVDKF